MRKIVIIEDKTEICENIAELLTLNGYQTIPVNNGMKGLETIRQESPDLVICDICMPGMDGLEVLKAYKNSTWKKVAAPFLFVSALAEKTDIHRALSLGATHYLVKPFTEEQLIEAIMYSLQPVPDSPAISNSPAVSILPD